MLKNKRLLLIGLVLLLLAIIPNMVNADVQNANEKSTTSTGKEVTWSYELDGENAKNLKCTNISSVSGDLTIPSTIDGHNVVSIGKEAFKSCTGLTGVTIPDTITNIGSSAFYGCSGLKNIKISNNLQTIESHTFNSCTGLKTIEIPNSVSKIDYGAFMSCSGLTTIVIPDSVISLGSSTFSDCSGLKSIKLSNNLTKLDDLTFERCTALTEIELPESLTTIDCNLLSGGGAGYGMYSPFYGCTALKYIKIPKAVVSIGNDAFSDCKNLTIYAEEGSTAAEYAKNNNIKLEKIENWDKRNENAGSDVSAPTVTSMLIDYKSIMDHFDSNTNDYRIPRNVEISIVVEFSEQIKGTQIPTLTIKCGEGANIELKNGTITGNKIVYSYKIKQEDEGLIAAVKFEGGDISDYSGNKAVLSVKELRGSLASGYVYAKGSAVGSNTSSKDNSSNSSTSNGTSNNESKKDTTVATAKLPNTGKVILAWIIGIVAVSGITAHIRYKKIYIK